MLHFLVINLHKLFLCLVVQTFGREEMGEIEIPEHSVLVFSGCSSQGTAIKIEPCLGNKTVFLRVKTGIG